MSAKAPAPDVRPNGVHKFFADLGPGLITGAADDDPSGISTYSVAGAAFGYTGLWTALFSFPLMAGVQLMCARLGLVSGQGLAGVLRLHYPRWVLWTSCLLLVVANIFNIGADLGGMANAMQMVTGIRAYFWNPAFAALIIGMLFWTSYRQIVRVFKWLTLVLFAYVIAAFLAHPNWAAVLHYTFLPHVEWNSRYFSVLVGILGTTISPYLFFWQAAQEVEEEVDQGRTRLAQRKGASVEELRAARNDVVTGMFFSNFVMYFIILTTAATLNAHGTKDIETAEQAARALLPLAGPAAYWLFTLGLIGTGVLAVPVLAGSCAYAIAEASLWRHASLQREPRRSKKFYSVLAGSVLVGLGLEFAGLNAVKMLFWSAVLNGILAPPLVFLVVLVTSDARVMHEHVNSSLLRWLGWVCGAVMLVAAVSLLFT